MWIEIELVVKRGVVGTVLKSDEDRSFPDLGMCHLRGCFIPFLSWRPVQVKVVDIMGVCARPQWVPSSVPFAFAWVV